MYLTTLETSLGIQIPQCASYWQIPIPSWGREERRSAARILGGNFFPAENTIVDFTVTSSKNDDI